jgi:hypothetical protein
VKDWIGVGNRGYRSICFEASALPHLSHYLRDGVLCAPFGLDMAVNVSTFFIVLRNEVAGSDAVQAFVAWLRSEVRRDGELTLAPLRPQAAG